MMTLLLLAFLLGIVALLFRKPYARLRNGVLVAFVLAGIVALYAYKDVLDMVGVSLFYDCSDYVADVHAPIGEMPTLMIHSSPAFFTLYYAQNRYLTDSYEFISQPEFEHAMAEARTFCEQNPDEQIVPLFGNPHQIIQGVGDVKPSQHDIAWATKIFQTYKGLGLKPVLQDVPPSDEDAVETDAAGVIEQ